MRTIDKINYYLAKQQKNGSDLCEYLGVSSGVYSQWNTGRTNPRKSKMPVIAEYLGVNVEDIQGEDETKKENPTAQGDGVDTITEKEVRMLKWFRSLPEEKLRAILISQDAPKDLLD